MNKIDFIAPATIQNYRTLADGSCRLTVDSQEMTPSEVAALHSMLKTYGTFCFTTEENPTDVFAHLEPPKEIIGDKPMSESEYTRKIIFALSKQIGEDFDELYKREYKKFNDYLKKKFPQEKNV